MRFLIDKSKYFERCFAGKSRIVVFLVFFAVLLVGLYVYKDYGMSWDEQEHRTNGIVNVRYVSELLFPGSLPQFDSYPRLSDYGARDHGAVFDMALVCAEILSGYGDHSRELYFLRHLLTFLLFYISVIFFFLIVRNRFDSWHIGLLGSVFLVLSPRIFAEAYYNLKDITFLSLFIISIYFLIRYLNNKTYSNAVIFGLLSALAIDVRMPGAIIPCMAIAVTAYDILGAHQPPASRKKQILTLLAYAASCVVFIIVFWPNLWKNPLLSFRDAFFSMTKYKYAQDFGLLYLGKIIPSSAIPWHYIPVWLVITTPVVYTLFFAGGVGVIIHRMVKKRWGVLSQEKERQDIIFLLLFLAPLSAVILFRSNLYDGWRQMYFIYAPFLLVATGGLNKFIQFTKAAHTLFSRTINYALLASVVLSLIYVLLWMVKYHPHQNVYFNLLAEKHADRNFDRDYWGLSYRKALEYIAQNDKRPVIRIKPDIAQLFHNNVIMLKEKDAVRFSLADWPEADYFIGGYRLHPAEYPFHEWYSVSVGHSKIVSVFMLR